MDILKLHQLYFNFQLIFVTSFVVRDSLPFSVLLSTSHPFHHIHIRRRQYIINGLFLYHHICALFMTG